jgi:two-component system phosphate regulon sensor histidine kinase PhoR
VPAEDRERIFERFVRGSTARSVGSERPVRGSGIGLALVKHIAQSHGGLAWVESAPGGGASFAISIPVPPPAGPN